VRECLIEAAKMAEDEGVTLALQNHEPIIRNYQDMLDFIAEVDSPALKACLDRPLLKEHTEDYYRKAIRATGDLMVHTHYGGRFQQHEDKIATLEEVVSATHEPPPAKPADQPRPGDDARRAHRAETVLEGEPLPLEHRRTVRLYFGSIRPKQHEPLDQPPSVP